MKALFLGRFQPFHNAHLVDIKRILKEVDEIVILIGSAQHSNTKENPFSIEERKEMIKRTLDKNNIKNYRLIIVDDIRDNGGWVEHCEKFIPRCDVVYTANSLTKKLFSEKYKVVELKFIRGITATEIRKRILKNKNWKELVPEEAAKYIEGIKGVERIKSI